MERSQYTEQQLMDQLTDLVASRDFSHESDGQQPADLSDATWLIRELNDRFARYVAIRQEPADSGNWVVVDI